MSKFEIKKTNIDDLVIVQPMVLTDTRGFFLKIYSEKYFDELGILKKIKEENHLKSRRGVLRGLHFQIKKPQGKLVRVVKGRILDVVVDLRKKVKHLDNGIQLNYQKKIN